MNWDVLRSPLLSVWLKQRSVEIEDLCRSALHPCLRLFQSVKAYSHLLG